MLSRILLYPLFLLVNTEQRGKTQYITYFEAELHCIDKRGKILCFHNCWLSVLFRRFISFRCNLDRIAIMHQFREFNNLPTAPLVQREGCMGVLGVYTVHGETTRNPTYTMVKPLDSNVQLQL